MCPFSGFSETPHKFNHHRARRQSPPCPTHLAITDQPAHITNIPPAPPPHPHIAALPAGAAAGR